MPRTPIAVLAGAIGFAAYVVVAVTLGDTVAGAHWALQAGYFLLAGTLWVIPVRSLMYWAARA